MSLHYVYKLGQNVVIYLFNNTIKSFSLMAISASEFLKTIIVDCQGSILDQMHISWALTPMDYNVPKLNASEF